MCVSPGTGGWRAVALRGPEDLSIFRSPTTVTVLTLEGKLRVLAAVHGYHNSPGHFVPSLAGDVSHTTARCRLVCSLWLFVLYTDRLGRPEFSCRQRVTRTCSPAIRRVRIIVHTNSTQVTDRVRYLTVVHCIHRCQVHRSLFYSHLLFYQCRKFNVLYYTVNQLITVSYVCLPWNSDQGCFRLWITHKTRRKVVNIFFYCLNFCNRHITLFLHPTPQPPNKKRIVHLLLLNSLYR